MTSKKLEGRTVKFKAGTLLVKENEVSRRMFIIRKGKVRVFKNYMNQRVTLAVLGEGEVFGELSFFDAEPRSASVEALTELEVLIIDGDQASQQISELPSWVMPIFRSVFHRFREADYKITVLQSLNEYQKKAFKNDFVGKTVYMELMRFIKTLTLLYTRDSQEKGAVRSEMLLSEMDDLLGKRFIGLRVFWRLLKEHDFIDSKAEELHGRVELNQDSLGGLNDYLASEVQSERFMMLSHSAIALLRRVVGQTRTVVAGKNHGTDDVVPIPLKDLELETLPLQKEAMKELKSHRLLNAKVDMVEVCPAQIYRLYTYQTILKSFDHTIVNLD